MPTRFLNVHSIIAWPVITGLTIIYIAYYDPIIAILIAVCFMLIIKQNKLNSYYDESESNPLEVIRLIDHSNDISPQEKKEYFEDKMQFGMDSLNMLHYAPLKKVTHNFLMRDCNCKIFCETF